MHSILAARSDFSIGESILGIDTLVDCAKEVGAKAVALTDTMSITGMIDFTNRAKKAGIQPIIGCRLRLVDNPTRRKVSGEKWKNPPEYFVTYYVLSEKGLKILFRLLSLANSEERFYYRAQLGFDDLYSALRDATADDVAISTSDTHSVGTHSDAITILARIASLITARNVFLNLVPIDTPYWDTLNKRVIALRPELGKILGVPCADEFPFLVSRPALYTKDNADSADVMNAVSRNVKLSELWAYSPAARDLHPVNNSELIGKSINASYRLNARGVVGAKDHLTEGLKGTDRLVEMVKYTWSKMPVSLPVMADDEFAEVVTECKAGWSKRFAVEAFGHKPTLDELRDIYRPRLSYELSILKKLGFSGYFLLVQDIVEYAKSVAILVGPGRGSVGGSLVAYLMGITDCDPIRFGLLFERFINPDRIDLPDADLDFMSDRRGEIIDYLIKKYGQDRVAGISNFNTMAAASTIRDVGKSFGLADTEYSCSRLMEKAHGMNIPLVKQADLVGEVAAWRDKYKPIWDVCVKLDGTMKSLGRHASGIVVGGCDLVERAVIERRKDGATVNWDKVTVEDMGLVKVDILGLETLDLIDLTLKYIRKRHSTKVDLLRVPLDDAKVLANFAAAKTTGIFQFDGGGMRRLLKELGKDGVITFEEIAAATALYRPGPMTSGMMDSFWKRKQGIEDVEYDHPLMEPILQPTYGVMVFQEQVMQVSRTIAGYSGPDADKLRKIMGKKLPEVMAKERGKFVDGCVATIGCTPEWGGNLFDKIEGFAGYGFNKSHSITYSMISYQAMWLKTNFPVEFYAAALSLLKEEKLPGILKDAHDFGISVVMPDINYSTEQFEILTDTSLCIPFSRIKGLSVNAAKAIVKARNDGKGLFTGIADLQERVEKRLVHKGKVDALDKVGAFSRIEAGQLPSNHPDRIKDQRELIPGLVSDAVPIKRDLAKDRDTKIEILKVVNGYRTTHASDGAQIKPVFGRDARFMVIADAPTSGEERQGQMTFAESFQTIAEALGENGLARSDGYWTALIKRPKESKQVSVKEVATYLPYLEQEIDLLKPPAIVLMGSMTVRHFIPDFKGKASDSAGKVIYSPKYDANFVVGFSPGEIFYDPDKQIPLNEVFAAVTQLLF